MENYADIMFTKTVRAAQDAAGTGELYAAKYPGRTKSAFGPEERTFLEGRTSIYMATVSETGWPYVQHRGGPVGFLKVLSGTRFGFADYRGNQQFISKGNLTGEARVSIFAMDYPRKARLKLQGHARMIDAGEDAALADALASEGQGRVERLVTIDVVAMDWNCPQFITPRLDAQEIAALVGPELDKKDARIAELEAEIAALKGA